MYQQKQQATDRIPLLGVLIDRISMKQAIDRIDKFIHDRQRHYIVTTNPEFIVQAQSDAAFKEVLNEADLSIPDGIGILWASRILADTIPIQERVTGTDLMINLCQLANRKGYSVYLLGGEDNIPYKTAQIIKEKYPNLVISGYSSNDPGLEVDRYQIPKSDLLFVAYGHPTQEKWIAENLEKIPVKVAMGVGGAFDFISGKQRRAPSIIQKIGLEWLWRLITQPWRIKRQLALLRFVILIMRSRLNRK